MNETTTPVPAAPPVVPPATPPATPTPAPYVAPLSIKGLRLQDILSLVILAFSIYSSFRSGTPLPVIPQVGAGTPVTQHFYGTLPPATVVTGSK